METLEERLVKTLVAMDEERMEPCIHCKKVWYAIHHRDGVCHKCVEQGLPGRTQIAARQRTTQRVVNTIRMMVLLATVIMIFRALLG